MTATRSLGRVLILGGTTEARELADLLTQTGVSVISSLAGRLVAPRLPAGEVRIGGFGGPAAMAAWLREQQIAAVVDATHPFAVGIGEAADEACRVTNVPLLRLERPPWQPLSGDRWHRVPDVDAAARLVPELGRRALLAIGRQGAGAFARVETVWFLIRCIEPPTSDLPPRHKLLQERGPFTVDHECMVLERHRIDMIVTKNSGGSAVDAKLEAARQLGLPVVMIDRPKRAAAPNLVHDVPAAFDWVVDVTSATGGPPAEPSPESAASRST